ncbi:ATP-grasp domain-containing protein [Spiribacter halobius]|uniref:ATP-grasp domain-containing protein n=1 Tax=Sediminicurvatus halobius TaxID=2182432 RepID=A0A2U2N4G2_9GAMM|nr:hypothetical protein [Spiribacter halobius]PWG63854.1 hypothetical protein DEM34_06525 [Spiribacter halobius]UEX76257.1 hypothetical protein LMH63_09780 [Spiribacter halobius]
MPLITFDPFRSLGLPARYIHPERWLEHREALAHADGVLFPEYWQVNALVHGLGARIFPSAASYRLGHDKIEMTRALQAAFPDHVPETLILPSTPAALELALDRLGLPLVAKQPRASQGAGVALVETAAGLRRWAEREPVLYLQECLPAERDLRVVWVGDAVVTAYWRQGPEGCFHNNVARGGEVSFDDVPHAALGLVGRIARHFGIDHAGFDLMLVGGHAYMLEFNVLFGHDALQQAGIRLSDPIRAWLERDRTPPGEPPVRLAG